jgi:ATP-dependent DNA ligase
MLSLSHVASSCSNHAVRRAKEPPAAPDWIHEIKHNAFRILARRDKERVRLFTRNGFNFTDCFPKIAAAVERVRSTNAASRYSVFAFAIMPPCSVPSI